MVITGDAWADASALYDREAEYEESLPTCEHCGEKIFSEDCYLINGELWCEDCIDNAKVSTERFMED
jgi:formylmethanofuran dehydrogenase subunit E